MGSACANVRMGRDAEHAILETRHGTATRVEVRYGIALHADTDAEQERNALMEFASQ